MKVYFLVGHYFDNQVSILLFKRKKDAQELVDKINEIKKEAEFFKSNFCSSPMKVEDYNKLDEYENIIMVLTGVKEFFYYYTIKEFDLIE